MLHLQLHLHSLYVAVLCPTHPLYYTVALDSGSEARYVRRQGSGLGIYLAPYLPLQASCLLLLASRQYAWPRHIT